MRPFEQLVYDRFVATISSWDVPEIADTYALGLFYESFRSADANGDEVAMQGQLYIGYNTVSYWRTMIGRASSPEQAKWNDGFWREIRSGCVPRDFPYGGEPPDDELALRDDWCRASGITPEGTDESGRPEYDEIALYAGLRTMLSGIARALHENGVIEQRYGKPLPIIVRGHEQSADEEVGASRRANPSGVSHEIEAWAMTRR